MIRACALALLLTACAAPTPQREGPISSARWPQAQEQCAAQPHLAWCKGAR